MKRAAIAVAVLVGACTGLISCGSYNSSGSSYQGGASGLKFRAFVSNPLRPTLTGIVPVLEIVDALLDKLSPAVVSMSATGSQPGLMAVSPNKKFTLVFSAGSNSIAVVDNGTEKTAIAFGLPGLTESMFVWIDNATAYAAVRNVPVLGEPSPGAVEVLNLGSASISATVPVANARYIVPSHNGNRILAFGDNQDTVTLIAPSLIGTNQDPRTFVCSDGTPQTDITLCDPNPVNKAFDRPVGGIFSSDDSVAYILNCGPQCGGTTAGITVLDMSTNSAGAPVPVAAATIGLLSGSTLYVAGTLPSTACGSGTAAPACGTLDVLDVGSMTVTGSAEITDGYHTHMEMGANGQLFIGARTCSSVNLAPSGGNPGEVRGCLSIFDTHTSNVVVPPDQGDVTGIAPIPRRSIVYVVEDGELRIYDTTTDKLQTNPTQINIIGQAIDVKVVDF